jgi:hypothetical protein
MDAQSSDDWMKGNPATPGDPLPSKPAWPNTSWVFAHVGFFLARAGGSDLGRSSLEGKGDR